MKTRAHRISTRLLGLALACGLTAACGPTEAQVDAPPPRVEPELVAPVPFSAGASRLPADWRHGTFMQVYVRAYQDSNADGIGDLKGLIGRLDYLQGLGVSGLWLMPIHASQDHDHGYAVTDYRAIEPDYGTLADFDALIEQAHRRGIGVIMDYTINHSAAEHPLFESSRASRHGPYRDWYLWRDKKPDGWSIYGQDPWHEDETGAYFGAFWDQMPDFNLRNPAVLAWHEDNLRFWLNRGVDGFRFDAVGNLVENGPLAWEGQAENHLIMHRIRELLQRYDNKFMVCEAPGDPLAFGREDSCGCSFAFGHNQRLVAAALGDPSAVERVADYYRQAGTACLAPFTSNHDAFAGARLWDRMQGDVARYRLAAATYLLQQPAPPFIYYGEEIGMSGAPQLDGDHRLRAPMSWTAEPATAGFTSGEPFRALAANHARQNVAAEIDDPQSLWTFYRDMIHLRQHHSALLSGEYRHAAVNGWMMAFQRVSERQQAVLVFNYGAEAGRIDLAELPARARLHRLWPAYADIRSADDAGRISLVLPGTSFAVFEVLD